MVEGKKIFITGGAGFIASHLIERLIEKNQVTIYDNLHRNAFKFLKDKDHKNLRFIQGDVLDFEKLAQAMEGNEIVVHAAAIAGIYSVSGNVSKTIKVNTIGTYHALEAAVRHKVRRFVDFSTSEVYGPFCYLGKESDSSSIGPVKEKRWVYAASKLASEHLVHAYGTDYGIETCTVRPFNVYGPRQIGEGAIQQMVLACLKNDDVTVYNDGTQIRSWCFVTDFVDGLYRTIHMDSAKGRVFNIGSPLATTTIYGLAENIINLTKSKSKIVFKPHPGPEVEMRIPDITEARTYLGYSPQVGLQDGLTRAVEWYRANL